MAEKRITKKEYFAMVAGIVEQTNPTNKEELLAFINHEVELLEKKSAKSGQTKTQKENVGIMETISEVLADMGKPVTITELMKDERLSAYSNQKLSALVKQMPNVVKTTEKKKSYFSLVDTEQANICSGWRGSNPLPTPQRHFENPSFYVVWGFCPIPQTF